MRRIIGTAVVIAITGVLGAATLIYSGAFSVAASEKHYEIVHSILDTARVPIKAHAAGIAAPADLDSEARSLTAPRTSRTTAACHSAPGVEAEDMADGMYPNPPVLTDVAKRYTPGELFWILKHGIKMSGMPSWGDHGKPVMASMAAGGHHTHGGTGGQNGDGHAYARVQRRTVTDSPLICRYHSLSVQESGPSAAKNRTHPGSDVKEE